MPGFDVSADTIAAPANYPSKGPGEFGMCFCDNEGNPIQDRPAASAKGRRGGEETSSPSWTESSVLAAPIAPRPSHRVD